MPPELILALFGYFAPMVRDIIAKHQAQTGELPTDEQMLATFQANADRILSEGAAWKASHPDA